MPIDSTSYRHTLATTVPRILMMWNRDPMSPAYGSFDRNFWNFKTLTDFSCATYQQAVLALSELYTAPSSQSVYSGQSMLLEAIRSGVLFWCQIQHKDGSQDEYYQNERSYCATAFTTFAIARAFSRMPQAWNLDEQQIIKSKVAVAADWLDRYSNPTVQNQMIASMNALYWAARITGEQRHKLAFDKRRAEVLQAQNSEGWFPEYGGADIGYSFKQLDFLCCYLAVEADQEIESAARRLVRFLVHFLHPDGTAGGSYGSRCTEHVFPFGIEWMARRNSKEAVAALGWYRLFQSQNSMIGPNLVDDKYLVYFYFFSFVQSALLPPLEAELPPSSNPIGEQGLLVWKQAGLLRWADNHNAIWISRRKNGVLRWFCDGKCESSNSGYEIVLADGRIASTQCENFDSEINLLESNASLELIIRGNAGELDVSLPLVRWIVPFKWVCRTLLAFDFLAIFYSRWLKRTKISESKSLSITVERRIALRGKTLSILDRISSQQHGLKKVLPIENVTLVHSPSSRYFQNQYLQREKAPLRSTEGPHDRHIQWEINVDV